MSRIRIDHDRLTKHTKKIENQSLSAMNLAIEAKKVNDKIELEASKQMKLFQVGIDDIRIKLKKFIEVEAHLLGLENSKATNHELNAFKKVVMRDYSTKNESMDNHAFTMDHHHICMDLVKKLREDIEELKPRVEKLVTSVEQHTIVVKKTTTTLVESHA
jgi:hypothetical protein